MKQLTPRAIKALNRVKEAILAEPLRVNMEFWLAHANHVGDVATFPTCGTVGCINGWLHVFSITRAKTPKRLSSAGKKVRRGFSNMTYSLTSGALYLGLDPYVVERLFYVSGWPAFLADKIDKYDPQTPEYAAIVAEAIDYFIVTDGEFI